MKKKLSLLSLLIIFSATLMLNHSFAQSDTLSNWKTGGETALTFSQVSLTNWAAGGENSLAANAFVSLFANYKKNKSVWDNSLDLAYGLLKQGDTDVRKSEDKIDMASKYGYEAFKHWYYSALLGFKSQFSKGYDYPDDSTVVSKFLAPAYITLGLGLDYKPNDIFSLFISPATGRILIVNDQELADLGKFGVEPAEYNDSGSLETKGKKVRAEFGGTVRMLLKTPLVENVDLQTKLELFSDYLDNPQNIDVIWDLMITMKVNKFLSANISTNLIYDDNVTIVDKDGNAGPRTQFKEVLGVGFSYKF